MLREATEKGARETVKLSLAQRYQCQRPHQSSGPSAIDRARGLTTVDGGGNALQNVEIPLEHTGNGGESSSSTLRSKKSFHLNCNTLIYHRNVYHR